MPDLRPPALRRSWLFVPGADPQALAEAATCGADVLIQELEDFTAPTARPAARRLAAETYQRWRVAGRIVAVRVNPLAGDGMADLAAAMAARPDVVMLPKVDRPALVIELAAAVERLERQHAIPLGTTELVPDVESARGLNATVAIATASPRVVACLVASEDMAADLRGRPVQCWLNDRVLQIAGLD